MAGKLVVIDGPDYSGKSTAIQLLSNHLTYSMDIKNIVVGNPGATWIGKKLREIIKDPKSSIGPETRAMAFVLDNLAFQEEIARPLENTDTWILSDRNNVISALAYQTADGIDITQLLNAYQSFKYRMIDRVIILDIDWETRQARAKTRGNLNKDFFERDKEHFEHLRLQYKKLSNEYRNILEYYVKEEKEFRELAINIIDANCNQEEVLNKILSTMFSPF